MRRLKSGALLLVKHGGITEKVGREKPTAFVSDDDGTTWSGGLTLDDRDHLTYPDVIQAVDGTIYVVYDRNRTPDGIIQMAVFREDDVRAGKPVSDVVRLKQEIDRLPAME